MISILGKKGHQYAVKVKLVDQLFHHSCIKVSFVSWEKISCQMVSDEIFCFK